jgi:hypothetical protein
VQSINYEKLRKTLLKLCVFLTIVSQMPFLRERLKIDTQSIAYPIWILMFCVTVIASFRIRIEEIVFPLSIFSIFIVAMLIFEIISNNEYISSVLVMPIIISIMMLIIGYLNSELFTPAFLKDIAAVYVFATFVMCVDIYFEYLRGYDFGRVIYVYRSKNSAGQLIVTALVQQIFMLKPSGIKRIVKYGVIAFLLLVIVLMRSRASIVSLIFILITYIFSRNVKTRNKLLVILALIAAILVIVFNDTVFNLVIRNLILNTTDNRPIDFSDINRISSHRYSFFKTFATLFPGNELIGIGSYYMDNFYMEVILNYGVFIGVFIIALALFPIKVAFAYKNSNIESILAIRIIALSYAFNGIFEGLAPFGPGAKCFYLWLIVGVLLNRNEKSDTQSKKYILHYANGK